MLRSNWSNQINVIPQKVKKNYARNVIISGAIRSLGGKVLLPVLMRNVILSFIQMVNIIFVNAYFFILYFTIDVTSRSFENKPCGLQYK